VIAAYLDETFDMRHLGLFVVGGLVGRGEPLFELGRKWERLLHRPGIQIEYYKASECEMGTGQFSKFVKIPRKPSPSEKGLLQEISYEFLSLIVKEAVVAHGIAVMQRDFYEVIKDARARSILGEDPFQLAYDLTMVQCAWMVKQVEKIKIQEAKLGQKIERECVSFVRDNHAKYSPVANERYQKLMISTPAAGAYMGAHDIEDDKTCLVLQAADAAVYEIRRAMNIVHNQREGPIRGQFQLFRDSARMAIIQTATKENLLNTVKLHEPGESFNLTDIMDNEFSENIQFEV
jgi:hypothetical protein